MTCFDIKFIFSIFLFVYIYFIFFIIFIRTLNNNNKSYEIRRSRYPKSNNINKKRLILNNENKFFFVIKLTSNNKNKKRLILNNENNIFDKKKTIFNIFYTLYFIFLYFYIFIFLYFYFLYKRDLKNTRFNVHNIQNRIIKINKIKFKNN